MATVVFTSGNSVNAFSISFEILMDCSRDAEGIEVTRHMIEPSCNVGINSLPRNGNSRRLTASKLAADITTFFLLANDHSSSGKYLLLMFRTNQVSRSSFGFNINAANTGITVSVNTNEPAIA